MIRSEFKNYIQTMCVQMALSKKYCDAYNNTAMSPVKHRDKGHGSRKNSDSDNS